MRSDSTRSTRNSRGNGNTEARPVARVQAPNDDMFVRFVDISNTLLSTSLRRETTLDDLLLCTLMLARDVAKSDIELVCLRVGDDDLRPHRQPQQADRRHLDVQPVHLPRDGAGCGKL